MIIKSHEIPKIVKGHWSTRGLVGYWPMMPYEVGGNKVFDLSGNGRTGTFFGDTHFVPGKFGSCLDFDGTDYVDVDFNPRVVIGSKNPFSFSVWINPGALSGEQLIMGDATGGTDRFLLGLSDINLTVGLGNNFDITDLTVSVGEWTHIFVTFDSSTTKVYKNAGTPDIHTFTYIQTYTEAFYFGQISASGGVQRYTGKIDVPIIWNRALPASEIAELYLNPLLPIEREPIELWVGATSVGEPPVGAAGIMTTNSGYWGPTF